MTSQFDIFHRNSGLQERILCVAGSLLINGIFFGGMEYASKQSSGTWEVESKSAETRLDEILANAPCTKNPFYGQVTQNEQPFITALTADIQDTHLDSMPFGTFMVTSEVYVHNAESYCSESAWDIQSRLQQYQRVETKTLAPLQDEKDPVVVVTSVFNELHTSLLTDPQDYQARPLIAEETGVYNCKSGTEWLTAIASAHPLVGDTLKLQVYDEHVRSLLQDADEEIFFENTKTDGANFKPKIMGEIREKENFVVEYLVGRGVSLGDLPEKFQEWFTRKAAGGLSTNHTNTFGIEAKVGIRSRSFGEEFNEAPSGYPSCATEFCYVDLDVCSYNWVKIGIMAYNKKIEYEQDVEQYWLIPDYYKVIDKLIFAQGNVIFCPDTLLDETDKRLREVALTPTQEDKEFDFVGEVGKDKNKALALLYEDFKRDWDRDYIDLYTQHRDLTVAQLEELLGPSVDPDHPERPNLDTYFIITEVSDYISDHYDQIQRQAGGQKVINQYVERLLQFNSFDNPNDGRVNYGDTWSLRSLMLIGLHDPALLEYALVFLQQHRDPRYGYNYIPSPSKFIVSHLDTIAHTSPQAFTAAHDILDQAFTDMIKAQKVDSMGNPKHPEMVKFCFEQPTYTQDLKEKTRDLALKYCQ